MRLKQRLAAARERSRTSAAWCAQARTGGQERTASRFVARPKTFISAFDLLKK